MAAAGLGYGTPTYSGVEHRRRSLSGWWAVVVVALSAAVAQAFGRFTFGLLLPAIRDDLGVSNSVAGLIGTTNVGAYLVGTLVVAYVTARVRLLTVMRTGFVCSTAGLLLSAFAPGAGVLVIGQFLSGFGGACIWIPAPIIATDALPPERRGLVVGLMGSGIGTGILFSGQLSGIARSTYGDAGWRTVYLVEAVIAVAVLLIVFAFLSHRQDRPTPPQRGARGGMAVLRRMPGWAPLTLAYTSFGFMYLLIIAFLTTKLEDDNGWTESETSLAFTLLGLAVIVGGPIFISLGRRIGPRFALASAFTGWSATTIVVLPGWFEIGLVGSAFLGMLFAGIPGMITLYVVENTSIEEYGPTFAAATLAFGLAQMLSPQVGGWLADLTGSFTIVFLLSAGFALTGTAASLRLPARERADGPAI